jgi:hypothetical protein
MLELIMCFVLYAGTTNALPRRAFDKDAPDLSVESLTERDAVIKQHFNKPEVQYIGSTSGCGCDFPHVTLQGGRWSTFGDDEGYEKDELDMTQDDCHRRNRESLLRMLEANGDRVVELYGVWDGGNENFAKPPQAREDILVKRLLDSDFAFKEQGFYRIHLDTEAHSA